MYRIYADGNILYAPHLFHEGCGVFSPKLTVELNKAGSLEYTMPPNNILYNDVKKLTSIITVYQDGNELFRGRVLNDEKDFYNQKKVYCEGELAFLLDSIQRPYSVETDAATKFKEYISNHNSRVEDAKKFTVGKITVESTDKYLFENDGYSDSLTEINTNIVEPFGGYLVTRGSENTRYIDWLKESGEVNSQTIEFGVNLLDITEYITAENIFTVLIPLGKSRTDNKGNDLGKLTIASVNDNKDYIEDATAISLFGRIERAEDWSNIEDAEELKKLGEELLSKNIELSTTLTVKAVDLYLLDVDAQRLNLGDWIRVISLPHSLDRNFQCTKIVYDLQNPDQTEYVFGVTYTGMTDQQSTNTKTLRASTTIVKNASAKANQAMSIVSLLPTQTEYDDLVKRIEILENNPGTNAEVYSGEYVVTPSSSEQTLETASLLMEDDVTVKEIPYYDVSNTSGGSTVYIGTEV